MITTETITLILHLFSFPNRKARKQKRKAESKTETYWEGNVWNEIEKIAKKRHADEAMENEDECYVEDDN